MSESPGRSDGKPKHLIEDLFIILCILSLWPTILGWDGPFYDLFLYGALAGLLIIFYRRMKRFRRARDELNRN